MDHYGIELLGDDEKTILEMEYPKFSQNELSKRHARIFEKMEINNIDVLVIAEFEWAGQASQWLTNWPATTASIVILKPNQPVQIIVEHYNHLPHARKMATDVEVIWGERKPIEIAKNYIKKTYPKVSRLGVIGRLAPNEYQVLSECAETLFDFNESYRELRLVKSDEELKWMRIGALFSDMALNAMVSAVNPGMTQRQLSAKTQAAYLSHGGAHVIEFMGVTQMADPDCCVPPQFPSSRVFEKGDVMVTEITSHFWNYPGQVLRTMTIEAEPTELYVELHAVAEEVLMLIEKNLKPGVTAADIFELSGMIEKAGFSIWDDLTHGYGGGYLSPVLGCASRPAGPTPDFVFEENMTIVIQPNIITRDAKAGVQTGGLVRINSDGVEKFQRYPQGLIRA